MATHQVTQTLPNCVETGGTWRSGSTDVGPVFVDASCCKGVSGAVSISGRGLTYDGELPSCGLTEAGPKVFSSDDFQLCAASGGHPAVMVYYVLTWTHCNRLGMVLEVLNAADDTVLATYTNKHYAVKHGWRVPLNRIAVTCEHPCLALSGAALNNLHAPVICFQAGFMGTCLGSWAGDIQTTLGPAIDFGSPLGDLTIATDTDPPGNAGGGSAVLATPISFNIVGTLSGSGVGGATISARMLLTISPPTVGGSPVGTHSGTGSFNVSGGVCAFTTVTPGASYSKMIVQTVDWFLVDGFLSGSFVDPTTGAPINDTGGTPITIGPVGASGTRTLTIDGSLEWFGTDPPSLCDGDLTFEPTQELFQFMQSPFGVPGQVQFVFNANTTFLPVVATMSLIP